MDRANRISFAGVLKVILDIIFAAGIVWLAFSIIIFIVLMIDPDSKARVLSSTSTLYPLWDVIPGNIVQAQSTDPSAHIDIRLTGWVFMTTGNRLYQLMTMIGFLAWAGLFFLVVHQLRRFLATVKAGNPFCPENASRIRTIGWSIVASFLLKTVTEFSAVLYMKQTITVNGRHLFPPAAFVWDSLHLEVLFFGLVVLAISGIFRLGTRLKEEQELTI